MNMPHEPRRIQDFPTHELLADLKAADSDLELCRAALEIGVKVYEGVSVQSRIDANEKIIAVIRSVLKARADKILVENPLLG